jgi:hypothetical protein
MIRTGTWRRCPPGLKWVGRILFCCIKWHFVALSLSNVHWELVHRPVFMHRGGHT